MSWLEKGFGKIYQWATAQLYHSFAWAYDAAAWLVSFGYWSSWRLDALNYLKPGDILEIGFGTGDLLIELAKREIDVIGLEPSRQMQRIAGRKIDRKGLHVDRVRAWSGAIPFPDESFINIILTFPSNHILSETTLCEMKRMIRINGRIVILGLGVYFRSRIRQWLTGWFLWDDSQLLIRRFIDKVSDVGFSATLVYHDEQAYSLPVVILEKAHEK